MVLFEPVLHMECRGSGSVVGLVSRHYDCNRANVKQFFLGFLGDHCFAGTCSCPCHVQLIVQEQSGWRLPYGYEGHVFV